MSMLLALLVATAPSLAVSDIGAAVRRSTAGVAVTAPATAPLSGTVVIPLVREDVHPQADTEASFYVGEIAVGTPHQKLKVVFDTASGHVLVPHRACKNTTCFMHHRYSPWSSHTAMDVNVAGGAVQDGQRLAKKGKRDAAILDFTQSDLGSGQVEAVLVRDFVCMGDGSANHSACVDVEVLAATKMDEKPFGFMPCDGIVGLGLPGQTIGPLASFFGRLLQGASNVLPHFGFALGAQRGELHLGGHDLARLAAPLRWFPVDHSKAGYWQVAIQAVYVGNITVNDCSKGCHGVVDSAVSRLGVQANRFAVLKSALSSYRGHNGQCKGPVLTFDLGGMMLDLEASDYAGRDCKPLLGSLDLDEPEFVGVYAFGATVLRRYYAAFDWDQQRLGFAPLSGDLNRPSIRSRSIPTDLAGMLLV